MTRKAPTDHDELIAAASVMNDMLDAEQMQQMQQERVQADEALKNKMQGLFDFSKALFITLPEYTKDTKFAFDISPAKLCDHLYANTVSPEQVYTVLSNTHNDYLVQPQAIMKGRFNRFEFEPEHELQIITYANFINNRVQKRTGSKYYLLDQPCPLVQARLALERLHRCSSRSTRPARHTRGLSR